MAKLQAVAGAMAAAVAIGDMAHARDPSPINDREVVGAWILMITPAEREGLEINIEIDDGDLPLTITGQGGGRIACVLRGAAAPCRIDRGRLVIGMPTGSGAARMTFTLTDRTRDGFSGAIRMSVRFLPIGGHIGAVTMTRRQATPAMPPR
ncbi:MAG: hypothetical protein H2038_12435 [Brevundimonas sp.]|uniref:hypothetical protein n=1 Tax=Brevundimonas sp. TaxID=1871086 RepID=UPI0017ECCD5C|nr:hypothetical protein [Brevundimonas sp.]MBA4805448.1 hypothetical protein [Brevundimonas sp.]